MWGSCWTSQAVKYWCNLMHSAQSYNILKCNKKRAETLTWKSGPMSTSNPRSAKPVAMTFAPRSWPSCPIFATSSRGFLPSCLLNSTTLRMQKRRFKASSVWDSPKRLALGLCTCCGPRRSLRVLRTRCDTLRSPSVCWPCVPQTLSSWHQWFLQQSIFNRKKMDGFESFQLRGI